MPRRQRPSQCCACFDVLHAMKQRGLHFDPQLAQIYQQLAEVFGG